MGVSILESTAMEDMLFDDMVPSGKERKQPSKFIHGADNLSGAVEWYTPSQYVDAARDVMGSIDVDPASSDLAQETIRAGTYYTINDDGLGKPWWGNVWLNPPYKASIITPFVNRLLDFIEAGKVNQAILLTHNNIDTAWFHKAARRASAFCATRGRVRFYNAKGEGNSPTHGHAFLYFGRRHVRFGKRFAEFGLIFPAPMEF